jgi:hypothetical protein
MRHAAAATPLTERPGLNGTGSIAQNEGGGSGEHAAPAASRLMVTQPR